MGYNHIREGERASGFLMVDQVLPSDRGNGSGLSEGEDQPTRRRALGGW